MDERGTKIMLLQVINESKLEEYIEDESIMKYDSLEEFLGEMNIDRLMYEEQFPNEFTSFEDVVAFSGHYTFMHDQVIYWISYDHALDVYEA